MSLHCTPTHIAKHHTSACQRVCLSNHTAKPTSNQADEKEQRGITLAVDLGNWLNGKMVLYLEDLADPNNGLNLVQNTLINRTVAILYVRN
jgi:hypothetical protein